MRIACTSVVLLAVALPLSAQTVTAHKTSERPNGSSKQCFYAYASNEYSRNVGSEEPCPQSIKVKLKPSNSSTTQDKAKPTTVTAFKTREEAAGDKRWCHYSAGSQNYTRTVQSSERCPATIAVRIAGK